VAGAAETLMMDNGDRLQGRLLRMSDNVLEFETDYAGKIRVNWSNVREIRSDGTFDVCLPESEVISVRSLTRQNDQVLLDGQREQASNVTQINPADWETGKKSRFSGELDTAVKLERGNTHENRTDVTSRMEWNKMRHRIQLAGKIEHSDNNSAVTIDNWSIESSYDNTHAKRSYFGARTSLKSDGMSDLNLRWATGPHIGFRFIESSRTALNAETGMEYTSENYRSQPLDTFLSESWRVEFTHFLIPGKLELYHRDSGRFNLTNTRRISFDTWNGVKLPIAGGLNTSAEIKTAYDGDAPPDVQSLDLVYWLRVGYQW
jgi:hypothetical protein